MIVSRSVDESTPIVILSEAKDLDLSKILRFAQDDGRRYTLRTRVTVPRVTFTPPGVGIDVDPNTKLLAAANRAKAPMRFGCASCRCGTCGVRIDGEGSLTPMKQDEQALLTRMLLPIDGTVRLACQARVVDGDISVDLAFQNSYSPDQGDE